MEIIINGIIGAIVLILIIRAIQNVIKKNKQGGCGCGGSSCTKS